MANFVCFGILKYSTITENKLAARILGEGDHPGPFSEGLFSIFFKCMGKYRGTKIIRFKNAGTELAQLSLSTFLALIGLQVLLN